MHTGTPGLFFIYYPYPWPGARFSRHRYPGSGGTRVPGQRTELVAGIKAYMHTEKCGEKIIHERNGTSMECEMIFMCFVFALYEYILVLYLFHDFPSCSMSCFSGVQQCGCVTRNIELRNRGSFFADTKGIWHRKRCSKETRNGEIRNTYLQAAATYLVRNRVLVVLCLEWMRNQRLKLQTRLHQYIASPVPPTPLPLRYKVSYVEKDTVAVATTTDS